MAIGLPFFLGTGGLSAASTAPTRLITFFFGNGLSGTASRAGFSGPLAPLAPFASQTAFVRGLRTNTDGPGNDHVKGSTAFACGRDSDTELSKGGATIDWVAHQNLAPGTPLSVVCSGVMGMFGGTPIRFIQSWRGVDQPNEPTDNVLNLFHQIFGTDAGRGADPNAALNLRLRTSVLDAVMEEYRSVTSERSGYGPATRQRIRDHMDTVREVEERVLAAQSATASCSEVEAPPPVSSMHSRTLGHWTNVWPLLKDVYLMGMRCDMFRFGNLCVFGGGDKVTDWPGTGDTHGGVFHERDRVADQDAINRWVMERLASFLQGLADPAYADYAGTTLLDRTVVVAGSELSDHLEHSREDMTYMLTGGGGRFVPGDHELGGRSDVDLYNTILQGMGVSEQVGNERHRHGPLPILG